MVQIMKTIKVPVVGFLGGGTGAVTGTLMAEWTSRSTGQLKWNACGVKSAVKFGVGLLGYGISTKLDGAMSSFFAEMFAYGCWGSIFFDIALAAYPGGIPGLAEDWAITARTMAAGGRRVVRELSTLERKAATSTPARETVPASVL